LPLWSTKATVRLDQLTGVRRYPREVLASLDVAVALVDLDHHLAGLVQLLVDAVDEVAAAACRCRPPRWLRAPR
jgi:hypothetical protein